MKKEDKKPDLSKVDDSALVLGLFFMGLADYDKPDIPTVDLHLAAMREEIIKRGLFHVP